MHKCVPVYAGCTPPLRVHSTAAWRERACVSVAHAAWSSRAFALHAIMEQVATLAFELCSASCLSRRLPERGLGLLLCSLMRIKLGRSSHQRHQQLRHVLLGEPRAIYARVSARLLSSLADRAATLLALCGRRLACHDDRGDRLLLTVAPATPALAGGLQINEGFARPTARLRIGPFWSARHARRPVKMMEKGLHEL